MEPRVSLTWYVTAFIIGSAALSLAGYGKAAAWTSTFLGLAGVFLCCLYLAQRLGRKQIQDEFRKRRAYLAHGHAAPEHRRRLDWVVASQWAAVLVVGVSVDLFIREVLDDPLSDLGLVFDVVAGGWMIFWGGTFLSAMVDWYLVLPKVSGISCKGPCEDAGRQRWSGVTSIWTFHRGVARLLLPFVAIGTPAWIGASTENQGGQTVAFIVATLLAVYLVDLEAEGKDSVKFALNPRRYVGDLLWIVEERLDSVRRVPAYVVDVAAEGAKFKYLEPDGSYNRGFARKHDESGDPIELKRLNSRMHADELAAPCKEQCTGVNWYCWNNELAYSQTTESE